MSGDAGVPTDIPIPKEVPSQRISKLINIEDPIIRAQEVGQYIKERLAEITVKDREALTIFSGKHEGFITPATEVKQLVILEGFVLDDPEVYSQLIENIRDFKIAWGLDDVKPVLIDAVQWTVGNYFGNHIGYEGLEEVNNQFAWERLIDEGPFSIKDYKEKGIAVCAQKAALAENLLVFSGADVELILSPYTQINSDHDALHAYNIIKTKSGQRLIYDPTNPQLILDDAGNVKSFAPAVHPVTSEQYADLMVGGRIEIAHNTFLNNNSTIQSTETWKYGGPQKDFKMMGSSS